MPTASVLTHISVQPGNWLYFVPIALLYGTLAFLLYLCGKKGEKWTMGFIEVMYWVNFAGHILKQFVPSYMAAWPNGIARSTAENFCALYVMIAPFAFRFFGKYGKDYLCYMGIYSAVLVYFFPTGAIDAGELDNPGAFFEAGRFYFCHAPLLFGGVLMLARGTHRLDYRRVPIVALLIGAAMAVTYLNNLFLNAVLYHYDWKMVLERNSPEFNSSFQTGPGTWVDPYLSWLYPYLIPGLQTYYLDGVLHFTPILYILPFAYPLLLLLGYGLAVPLDFRHIRQDHYARQSKRRLDKLEKEILAKEANTI